MGPSYDTDYAMAMCIEQEKEKCLKTIQSYYKKNKHPSVLRLRDYLESLNVQDPTVLEDLERIKIYIASDLIADGSTHEPFATDA